MASLGLSSQRVEKGFAVAFQGALEAEHSEE